jgi:hypothetical protein
VSTIEKGDKGEDEIELFHVPIHWISNDQKQLQYPWIGAPISYKVSGK